MVTLMTIVGIIALVVLPTAVAAFIAASDESNVVEEFDYDYR